MTWLLDLQVHLSWPACILSWNKFSIYLLVWYNCKIVFYCHLNKTTCTLCRPIAYPVHWRDTCNSTVLDINYFNLPWIWPVVPVGSTTDTSRCLYDSSGYIQWYLYINIPVCTYLLDNIKQQIPVLQSVYTIAMVPVCPYN